METKNINGKEYKLITIHNRSKWIASDGSAINPHRINQQCTVHYNSDGYPCFGGGIPVHLYVAKAWVNGYFEGAEVNHKDYDRTNFNADNLEWLTHSENVTYSAKENHYQKYGEANSKHRQVIITKDSERHLFKTILECCQFFKTSLCLKSTLSGIRSGIDRAALNNRPYRGWNICKI